MLDAALTRAIVGTTAAHRRLETALDGLTDAMVGTPTFLGEWTVGHLVTHLARNADSLVRLLEGARRGEIVPQYPGGREQRNGDIEAGARRSAVDLVADLRAANAGLEQCWSSFEVWPDGLGVDDLVQRRWREVEVHHADLGPSFGRSYRDWSAEYLRLDLRHFTMLWDSRRPMGMTGLPPKVQALAEPDRLAWLLGRLAVPGVEPAGLLP